MGWGGLQGLGGKVQGLRFRVGGRGRAIRTFCSKKLGPRPPGPRLGGSGGSKGFDSGGVGGTRDGANFAT